MDPSALLPFGADADRLLKYAKLPLHSGVGTIAQHGDPDNELVKMFAEMRKAMGQEDTEPQPFTADFVVPVSGNCTILLHWQTRREVSRNFGKGLVVKGDTSPDGPFVLDCPQYYVQVVSEVSEEPGWAIAHPLNERASVMYGEPRPIARVCAVINNFDFEYGNVRDTDVPPSIRVVVAGRLVEFIWRCDHAAIKNIVEAELIGTSSFVTLNFDAWPDATVMDLSDFVQNITTFLHYVVAQHVGIPMLTFLDAEGKPIKRLLAQVVQSEYRRDCALRVIQADNALPQLFRQGFAEHERMMRSPLWKRLPMLFAAIDDSLYLEQRYSTLMVSLELFIRNSLMERCGFTQKRVQKMTLPFLIKAGRNELHWDIPDHYTAERRTLSTRNAVQHGNSLPHAPEFVVRDLQKWQLFLLRRILIQLGYDGSVASPERGHASSSPVNDFSEEHNSFLPPEPDPVATDLEPPS